MTKRDESKIQVAVGTRLGHYQIVAPLGMGKMAEVYRARDTKLDREVAIKVLPGHLARDLAALSRFEVEAKALAALSHPNIVNIHEFGSERGVTYTVMELLEGETLRQRMEHSPLPWREAVGHATQMARGLSAAHNRGIAHRDLKPDNVVITTDGYVKILDFGIAKIRRVSETSSSRDSDTTLPNEIFPGTILGTAGYMSPEQARGEEADFRSDIFALGVILYEMLTGHRAFAADSLVETLNAVIRHDPFSTRSLGANVPLAVESIVRRCLEKDPDRRFPNGQALVTALEAVSVASGLDVGELDTDLALVAKPARATNRRVPPQNSIAVLPFTNMSTDPENEYFADGMTEEIINALAQLDGLQVVARTSAFSFKGKSPDLKEVGAKLNVEVVLEGSVRKAGDHIRITAQLINVADGYHVWSHQFDRTMGDVFTIQDEIGAAIVRKMEVTLGEKKGSPIVSPSTDNLEAYDLYLLGRFHQEQRGQGIQKSLDYFKRALELDPDFAQAHAGCADSYAMLGLHSYNRPSEIMPTSKASALRALELNDKLAEAHSALGFVQLLYDWNWTAGAASLLRAMELKPNYVPARYWYAYYYLHGVKGQIDDAIAMSRRTVELDPLATLPAISLGLTYYSARRGSEMVAIGSDVLARDPNSFMVHRIIGLGYMASGEYEKAYEFQEKAVSLSGGHPWTVIELALAHAFAGDHDYARSVQAQVLEKAKSIYISTVYLSLVPVALGEYDDAMAYLERAFEERDPLLITMRHWPNIDPIRDDPRFRDLMNRVGVGTRGQPQG